MAQLVVLPGGAGEGGEMRDDDATVTLFLFLFLLASGRGRERV